MNLLQSFITTALWPALIVLASAMCLGQTTEPIDYNPNYGAPGPWPKPGDLSCCSSMWPKIGLVNTTDAASFDYPTLGYPLRGALFVGMNDTFQVAIPFRNNEHSDYALAGKNLGAAFAPRVFRPGIQASNASLWRDSTDLGYRIRGWWLWGWNGFKRVSPPTKIPARSDRHYALAMDVWNLPEGVYCLCLDSTSNQPAGFTALPYGYTYEYREALNLADSTNAYEACFWRMVRDSNYAAALDWLDTIIIYNERSVPGWWLRGVYFQQCVPDTPKALDALSKALDFLKEGLDPAMPDSNARMLLPEERNYLYWCEESLTFGLQSLGP